LKLDESASQIRNLKLDCEVGSRFERFGKECPGAGSQSAPESLQGYIQESGGMLGHTDHAHEQKANQRQDAAFSFIVIRR
jgi:hypothetical protein